MYLNNVVIELFKKSGMNQKEFCKEYEISYSTFNHILNYESKCSINLFEKILESMNLKYKIEIL
jgi:predicted transcriptional regulator